MAVLNTIPQKKLPKITYLLGAGASCPYIPAANDFFKSILDTTKKLDELFSPPVYRIPVVDPMSDVGILKSDLLELVEVGATYGTLDNYAFQMYHNDDYQGLYKLKCLLSCYFSLHQLFSKNLVSVRYNRFWGAMLNYQQQDLPRNVRIVTWNYDSQLELSYANYCVDFIAAVDGLNIINNDRLLSYSDSPNRFTVYKMNGTAGFHMRSTENKLKPDIFHNTYYEPQLKQSITNIVDRYFALFSNAQDYEPTITFAWEHNKIVTSNNVSFGQLVRKDIADTEILVIIGYSFPQTNSRVDAVLFQQLSNLKKVYITDRNYEAVQRKVSRILGPVTVEYENFEELEREFCVPDEF